MIAQQQLRRLRIQVEPGTPAVQPVDAGPKRRIQVNRITVGGEPRCHLGIDLLDPRIAVAVLEVGKRHLHTRQQAAAALKRYDDLAIEDMDDI